MDIINREWVHNTNIIAEEYENGRVGIIDFTNDQLQYLIYWNFGYSGCSESDYSKNCRAELIARGLVYDETRATNIDALAEVFY